MKKTVYHSAALVLLTAGFIARAVYATSAQSDDSVTGHRDHLHHQHFIEFAKVPEKARARLNPLESDREAVAAGKKLFGEHCAECHGSAAEGSRKAPNLRAEEAQQATPGTLFWILTNGVVRRGMPVWSKLPEPERWQIVTFLKSLGPSPEEPNAGHDQSHPVHSPASGTAMPQGTTEHSD